MKQPQFTTGQGCEHGPQTVNIEQSSEVREVSDHKAVHWSLSGKYEDNSVEREMGNGCSSSETERVLE
ncbi:unnamed protein product [Linum trigynum]|uniref:Uncharacterized protein n=1 Tax=Linum trigynum TaxID=586398 RepID=A0AAV2E6L7_9ROSI